MSRSSNPGAPRAVPGWLVALALAAPLAGLTSPLMEVDDARYAEVPREMAASGDFVLPTLNGLPYVEKPPLWYWTAAVSMKALGPSEAAARLPMALFAALGALGAWWLGSWLFNERVARAAALATASSALWAFLAHNMTLDTPLSAMLIWTTALALRVMDRPEDARWAAPAAWAAAGLSFLAKGLISVVLPAAWVIGLAILYPRWRRGAGRLLLSWGPPLFLLIVVPWFALVQQRRPDFLHTFFVEQHFQRYLSPKYDRPGGWWFFLVVVGAGIMPWTAGLLAGLAAVVRAPFERREEAALAAWIAGVVLFFSLSHSKLATYALPVFPHACLLACAALDRGLPAWARNVSRLLGGLLLAAAAAALGLALFPPASLLSRLPPGLDSAGARVLALFGAAVLGALGAGQAFGASGERRMTALGLGGVAAGLLALTALRSASPLLSARGIATAVRERAVPGDRVWTYGCYLHGLPFYSGMLVDKAIYFVGELHYAKREAKHAPRFGDDNDVAKLPLPGTTFVVLRSFEKPHFAGLLSKKAKAEWLDFGPWSLGVVGAVPGK